jgi:hypothetical protein
MINIAIIDQPTHGGMHPWDDKAANLRKLLALVLGNARRVADLGDVLEMHRETTVTFLTLVPRLGA